MARLNASRWREHISEGRSLDTFLHPLAANSLELLSTGNAEEPKFGMAFLYGDWPADLWDYPHVLLDSVGAY